MGFTKPCCCQHAGSLLHYRFSFSLYANAQVRVFFSAALSVGSPRLAVSQHPALWRPDFPHSTLPLSCMGTPRLSGPLCMGDCITFIRPEASKSNNLQVNEMLRGRGFLAACPAKRGGEGWRRSEKGADWYVVFMKSNSCLFECCYDGQAYIRKD